MMGTLRCAGRLEQAQVKDLSVHDTRILLFTLRKQGAGQVLGEAPWHRSSCQCGVKQKRGWILPAVPGLRKPDPHSPVFAV